MGSTNGANLDKIATVISINNMLHDIPVNLSWFFFNCKYWRYNKSNFIDLCWQSLRRSARRYRFASWKLRIHGNLQIFRYVICSAKDHININKIFKELLNQVRQGSIPQPMNLPYLMMSLPAAPPIQKLKSVDEESNEVFASMTSSKNNSEAESKGAIPKQRHRSLALLRHYSCKIP